jgi:hypothetical protein
MTANKINATEAFGLDVVARCTIDGREWVVFCDGAYRHVVSAEHYDAAAERRLDDDEARADAYSAWCGANRPAWADDATAERVARDCGLSHVHSATDGCCGLVEVDA